MLRKALRDFGSLKELWPNAKSRNFHLSFRHLERMRIALDIEQNMSKVERKLKINKYWVDVRGERFLQVEHVDNELFKEKEEAAES